MQRGPARSEAPRALRAALCCKEGGVWVHTGTVLHRHGALTDVRKPYLIQRLRPHLLSCHAPVRRALTQVQCQQKPEATVRKQSVLLHARHLQRAANLQRVRSPHALRVVVAPLVAIANHHIVDRIVLIVHARLPFLQQQYEATSLRLRLPSPLAWLLQPPATRQQERLAHRQ
eukprot:6480016-Prymnesium_polylepis.1